MEGTESTVVVAVVVLSLLIYHLYNRKCENKEAILEAEREKLLGCKHDFETIEKIESFDQVQYIQRCVHCGKMNDEVIDKI